MSFSDAFLVFIHLLLKPSFLGIKLWMWLVLALSVVIFVAITVIFLYCMHCRRERSYKSRFHYWPEPKEKVQRTCSLDARLLNISGSLMNQLSGRNSSYRNDVESSTSTRSVVIKDAWRKAFSLSEINVATDGLAKESVVGIGDHGTVYRGVLFDGTRVAVKKLLINSFQVEESMAQMEELGHIKHKNLVKFLGYCFEGAHRILVSEYVDNKSLHYWLHECPQQLSPLTWSVRMNIIHGIARGNPIDRHRSQPYLVEWLKRKVETENVGEVVDPSLVGMPCSMELKRVLLVALRCVDPNEEHRPDMGDVTHMLEPRDLLLTEDELQCLSPT